MPVARWLQIAVLLVFLPNLSESMTIKGLQNKIHSVHICKGQPRNIACGGGELLWIRNASVGFTHTPGVCRKNSANGCHNSTFHYHQFSTSPTDILVDVPNDFVQCRGISRSVSFAHVDYSCIDSSQLNPQDMCAESTRVYRDDYITTPGFPSPAPNQLYDCTCHIQSVQPGNLNVSLMVIYANLPHRRPCAEEMWMEHEVGHRINLDRSNRFRTLCSNGTFMLLSNRFNHNSLTLGFVRNHQTVTGNSKLKIWVALQAEAEMRVTCGPSIVSTTIPTEWTPSFTPSTTTTAGTTTIATTISTPTVIVTASTPLEVDALGSEFHPGTIMTKEVSLPADGSMLNKNVMFFTIIGCVAFVVVQTAVLLVVCFKRKRSPAKKRDGTQARTRQCHHRIPEVYLSMVEPTVCGHRSPANQHWDEIRPIPHDTHGRSLSIPFVHPYTPPRDFDSMQSLPIHSVDRLGPYGHRTVTVGQFLQTSHADRFNHETLASADRVTLNGQATLPVRRPLPTPIADRFNHANPAPVDRFTPRDHATLGNGHTLPAPYAHRFAPQNHTTNAAGQSRQSTNDGSENPYITVLDNEEDI